MSKTEAVYHALGWLLYLAGLLLLWVYGAVDRDVHSVSYFLLSVFVYLPAFFYLNAFWLIPGLLQKKRWLVYVSVVVGVVCCWVFVGAGISSLIRKMVAGNTSYMEELSRLLESVIMGLPLVLLLSFGYRFSVDWLFNLGRIEQLKSEKASMELAFLKSQVDPHFLFNTLNGLYALALDEGSEKTADGIAKLGTLMRYTLHDAHAAVIGLDKEIDYIRKYIALQEIRMGDRGRVALNLAIDEAAASNVKIAPMLLISLVENAFKHGVTPGGDNEISISAKLVGQTFTLDVRNAIPTVRPASGAGGVGLRNIRQRLSKLYPGKYKLSYGAEENTYTAILTIELS